MPTATLGSPLPHTVDVFKLAVQGASLSGQVEVRHLPRLAESVEFVFGEASAELEFFIGDEGFAEVSGSVQGEVALSCQRCLGEMRQVLNGKLALGVVRKEEDAPRLPKRLEPWLVDSDSGNLHALIEDELLLMLPIVALHQQEDCEPGLGFSFGEDEESDDNARDRKANSKTNPFQVLEQFKKSL